MPRSLAVATTVAAAEVRGTAAVIAARRVRRGGCDTPAIGSLAQGGATAMIRCNVTAKPASDAYLTDGDLAIMG